jgi:insecticidal toxin complex protein TccC
MDVSGLYYYGARYYAPWLQRWVSADPAGDVDGLNLYAFVGNNPLAYVDDTGETKTPAENRRLIVGQLEYLSAVNRQMTRLEQQFDSLAHPRDFRANLLKNFIHLSGRAAATFFTALHSTGHGFEGATIAGEIQGLTLGNTSADTSAGLYERVLSPLSLDRPIIPRKSQLTPEAISQSIKQKSEGPLAGLHVTPTNAQQVHGNIQSTIHTAVSSLMGAVLPAVGELIQLTKVAEDANRAEEGLFTFELDAYEAALDQLQESVTKASARANAAYEELGVRQFYESFSDQMIDTLRGRVGAGNSRMIDRSTVQSFAERAQDSIASARLTLNRYRSHVARKTQERASRRQ